jgi:hypothetical protein
MKLSVFLAGTVVAFASMATAAPLCTDIGAPDGAVTTMADYVALGSTGCQIGDKVFYNFFYSSSFGGTAAAVPASAVFLAPVGADTFNPGIAFSGEWNVPGASSAGNSFIDTSLGFTVTVLPGGRSIDDASLTLDAFAQTGTGLATIGETVFAADGFTQLGGRAMTVSTNGQRLDDVFFASTGTIQVKKNFFVGVPQCAPTGEGCSASGSIAVSSFTENFSEIPEPVGAILIGSGLLALGAWRRRGSRG